MNRRAKRGGELDRDLAFDCRPRIVIDQGEVLIIKIEKVLYFRVEQHGGQRTWRPRQLGLHLFDVVVVDVHVAKGVDKRAGLQPAHLGHHHGQQGIGGDVERHAQEHVRTTLVELA